MDVGDQTGDGRCGMKSEAGLVSCVTPVYNGEKYLGAMLDSVLAQTYPAIEMILADDGSTDGTLEIAERYRERFAQKGCRYQIVCGPHRSASAAINRGLALVRGEFLIWPDSDDVLRPGSVEKRVDFLRSHPECPCVRSLMDYFDENGSAEERGEAIGNLETEDLFFDVLEGKTFVSCGCYMLRTERFFAIYPDRRIPEYSVGQNFQMLLPYLYRHRCHTIPERLYRVRLTPDGHSRRPRTQVEERKRYRDFERLVDELSEICEIRSLWEKRKIFCWKLERRKQLAERQGRRLEARAARAMLFVCGRSTLYQKWFPWMDRWKDRTMKHTRQKTMDSGGIFG